MGQRPIPEARFERVIRGYLAANDFLSSRRPRVREGPISG